jgi:hypothetical protein
MEGPREAGEGFWFKAGLRLILFPNSLTSIANVNWRCLDGNVPVGK